MTQANPETYRKAADLIAAGRWQVSPDTGTVFGVNGQAFTRTNSSGYIQIKFRDPDNWRVEHATLAHRVIWEHVHGPMDPDLTINHINGHKQDSRIVNLEAVTQAENVRHAFATGLNHHPPRSTHCGAGHEWTEASTQLRPNGGRNCRHCGRDNARARRANLRRHM